MQNMSLSQDMTAVDKAESVAQDADMDSNWAMLGFPDAAGVCPPQLAGLIIAVIAMLVGSLIWPNRKGMPQPLNEKIADEAVLNAK